ncbi:MAG: ribosome biogenesis factor YjgA [Sulfuriferula sp.]|nr:ribosome biogenesis factor YjgA [Sulfuriferula sp.]
MEEIEDEIPVISKSEIKRQMTALQKLGEELIALPKSKLDKLDLPENLRDAIDAAKRITAHGGLSRQKQYIGRLMRIIDAQPIAEQLEKWRSHHSDENAVFHQMEHWRTRLIEDDTAITLFIADHPGADVQQLRTLVRNARKEASLQQPPKSSRALFKLIRSIFEHAHPELAAEAENGDADTEDE